MSIVELTKKIEDGYVGLVINLTMASQNNETINNHIESIQKYYLKKDRFLNRIKTWQKK